MKRERFFIVIALLIGTVVSVLMAELLLRTFRPMPTYSILVDLVGEQYTPGDFIPFSLKPSYRSRMPSYQYPGRWVEVSTNALGLRGVERTLKKPSGVKRVLVIGDSYTFGVYVADSETYAAQTERILQNAGCHVEVLNAGYSGGWGPDTQYAWLVRRGIALEPDLVVYGFFGGNDFDDVGVRHWVALDQRGLPTRIVDPTTYIDAKGRVRSTVRDDVRTVGMEFVYRFPIIRESHLAVALGHAYDRFRFPKRLINKGWGPDPLRWFFHATNTPDMDRRQNVLLRLVRGMADVSAAAHADFMVLMLPGNYQVEERYIPLDKESDRGIRRDFHAELRGIFKKMKIPALDLLPPMRSGEGHYFPDNGEVHFNPEGHLLAARELSKWILESGLCEGAKRPVAGPGTQGDR